METTWIYLPFFSIISKKSQSEYFAMFPNWNVFTHARLYPGSLNNVIFVHNLKEEVI